MPWAVMYVNYLHFNIPTYILFTKNLSRYTYLALVGLFAHVQSLVVRYIYPSFSYYVNEEGSKTLSSSGLPEFSCYIVPKWEKYTKWPQTTYTKLYVLCPFGTVYGHLVNFMSIIFDFKNFPNIPKLGFWYASIPSGNPGRRSIFCDGYDKVFGRWIQTGFTDIFTEVLELERVCLTEKPS
jgi:hypothetical protein